MTKKELLISEIDQIPENLIDEVIDFVQFLKTKKVLITQSSQKKENLEITIASKSSLKKDWLSEQEDKAWQGL